MARKLRRATFEQTGEIGEAVALLARARDLLVKGGAPRAAICPAEGKGAGLVLPSCNSEAMALHLEEISLAVAPGAHAILLLD